MYELNKTAEIETLLFVVGEEGIELEELASLIDLSTAETFALVEALEAKYEADESSSLHILQAGNRFILTTKKDMAELLKRYTLSPISNNLSQAALETLSIVAYKQPIARVEVDEIRGVGSAASIHKLVTKNLIEEKGRLETPGRPILYGTTDYFMDYFGLQEMSDLPDIAAMEDEIDEEMPVDLFFERYAEKDIVFGDTVVNEENENETQPTAQTELTEEISDEGEQA